MEEQNKIEEILKIVQEQGKTLQEQGKTINDTLKIVQEQGKTINDTLKIVQEQGKTINDTLKIVQFVKDNAVTKDEFNAEITGIKATMVTKEYLDEKLADLRGDMVVLTRKEDTKLKALIKLLKNRKVISDSDEKQLLTLEPFAELII